MSEQGRHAVARVLCEILADPASQPLIDDLIGVVRAQAVNISAWLSDESSRG